MKKIVLGIISLFVWGLLPGYANMIYPGEELISIDELCAQLQKEMSDADTSKARMDVVRKQFADLNCESVLQNAAQPADNASKTNPSKETNPVAQPDSTNAKHDIRAYGLAGLLALLLSGSAFVLLWRTRKTMPRAL